MKIGITQTETNYKNYPKWFENETDVEIVELSFDRFNIEDISLCDGIVLSGGVDTHPKFFLDDYSENYPNAPETFILKRDEFELKVLETAFEKKIPVLGICRGMQLINVHLGGTLVLDIGEERNEKHMKTFGIDKKHFITVKKGTQFSEITDIEGDLSNSAHHQAIKKLGKGLKASAYSDDNLIEAIEFENPEDQFMIAVQWHPERMENMESPLSKNIKKAFLQASKEYGT